MKELILYSIIGGVASFLVSLPIIKKVIGKFYMPLKEVSELVQTILKAVEDKKITKEEIQDIIKEAKDVKNIFVKIKEKR